jgi:hypothetical protein
MPPVPDAPVFCKKHAPHGLSQKLINTQNIVISGISFAEAVPISYPISYIQYTYDAG